MTETFKLNEKWASLVLLLLVMGSAIVYKRLRGGTNAESNVQADIELPATATDPE